MKQIIKTAALAAALLSFASCMEFQPVFTGKYDDPKEEEYVTIPDEQITSIQDFISDHLSAMYSESQSDENPSIKITEDIIIKGQVISTDKPGNFYKSFYIQDESAGLEIKIGRNGLYNDYRPNQWVYIKCRGLYLGEYKHKYGAGSLSLGCKTTNAEKYPNSYMESPVIIDAHVLKGEMGEPVTPIVVSSNPDVANGEVGLDRLPENSSTQADNGLIGKLVTIKGASYDKQIFTLLYLDSNKNKDKATNRIFLSSPRNATDAEKKTWGVDTWGLSKEEMGRLLMAGNFDAAEIGSGNLRFGLVSERKNPKVAIRGRYVEDAAGHPGVKGEIVFVEGVTPSYGTGTLIPTWDFIERASLRKEFIVEGVLEELPDGADKEFKIKSYEIKSVPKINPSTGEQEVDSNGNPIFEETQEINELTVSAPSNYDDLLPSIRKVMGKYPGIERAAASVSQYFNVGSKSVQVRTSGYSKFSDDQIPEAVRTGGATADLTGIISMYQGNIQFTLIDRNSIQVN